jgi:ParB/RepB/Spo0J family partition protein
MRNESKHERKEHEMAVDFDVKGTRTSEYRFLPEYVEIDPLMNGRHETPDIQWIIDSILRHGQLQPVTIRRTANKPVLVAGFSRWRAVSEINKQHLTEKPLELRCSYTALTEKQAFLANIEENRVRNDTTPMDDAYNIQRLINVYQMSKAEVAESYRLSLSWVVGRLDLIEATPAVEMQIRKGAIKGPAARAVAKVSKEHQQNLAALAEKTGKVTLEDVRREIGAPEKPPAPVAAPEPQQQPVPAPKRTPEGKLLDLADAMCRLILDDNIPINEAQLAAEEYKKVRGLVIE